MLYQASGVSVCLYDAVRLFFANSHLKLSSAAPVKVPYLRICTSVLAACAPLSILQVILEFASPRSLSPHPLFCHLHKL